MSRIWAYIIVFLCFTMSLTGQGKRLEYSEDTTSHVGKYDRIYQVMSEQKVNVNTLYKFDGVQWGQLQPSFTVEQRLWKDFTVEPNLTLSALDWSRDGGIDVAFNPNLDFKYYFNRSRRERLGKNVIGFSADYFSIGFSYTLTDDKAFFAYELEENHLKPAEQQVFDKDYYTYHSWRIMYGIQRKIGNMAYADFSGGIERRFFKGFGASKLTPTLKVKLGFALSREQFKRLSR